ncbi:MAG TPA: hypothetical protein VGX71_07605 [Pseudaminobacter sp.]|nr:hypothetical protein [Pseudaminobacter sp.]
MNGWTVMPSSFPPASMCKLFFLRSLSPGGQHLIRGRQGQDFSAVLLSAQTQPFDSSPKVAVEFDLHTWHVLKIQQETANDVDSSQWVANDKKM